MSNPSKRTKRRKGPPVPELYPGHAAELERASKRQQEIEQANRNPLPGPLLDAFGGDPQPIAGLTVRPVVHSDFVILAKLDSPLLQHVRKPGTAETPYDDEQGYEIVYQFTRPSREVRAVLAQGREIFREAACAQVGDKLKLAEINALIKAVQREFVRSFSTVLGYEARAEEGQVFTPPPAVPQTASAGG